MQDSLSISTFSTKVELDTVSPIYIYKDTTVANADADMDYGFMEYTSQTLKDVLPKPVFEESLLKEKTFVLHKPLTLHKIQPTQYTQTWTFSIIIIFFILLNCIFNTDSILHSFLDSSCSSLILNYCKSLLNLPAVQETWIQYPDWEDPLTFSYENEG